MDVSSIGKSLLARSYLQDNSPDAAAARRKALDDQSDAGFSVRLEKHIKDVKRGRGYESKDVGAKIATEQIGLADGLDGKTSKDLYAYVGLFRYDRKARMVHAVKEFREDLEKVF